MEAQWGRRSPRQQDPTSSRGVDALRDARSTTPTSSRGLRRQRAYGQDRRAPSAARGVRAGFVRLITLWPFSTSCSSATPATCVRAELRRPAVREVMRAAPDKRKVHFMGKSASCTRWRGGRRARRCGRSGKIRAPIYMDGGPVMNKLAKKYLRPSQIRPRRATAAVSA